VTENWLELAGIIAILSAISVAVWKGGQANPVGTGSLDKEIAGLKTKVAAIDGKVGTIDGKLGTMEKQVKHIERRAASVGDIERLERTLMEQDRNIAELTARLSEHGEMLARVLESGEQRGKQMDRLYDFIVQRGMSK
jgi:septal ring factor EnvC (AmiA/AmiB activator)